MNDIAQCKVSLWFIGETLDPDELAQWLEHPAAYEIRKDEIYRSKGGEEMVAGTGRFQITSGWQTGKSVERQITQLLAQVPDEDALWQRINSRFSGEVVCGLILDSVNEELRLSTDILAALSRRGLSLLLDIYDSGDGPIPSAISNVRN